MGLGVLDVLLLVLSMAASVAIGVYYGIRGLQSTPLDYLLGGRSMPAFPLAMSVTVGTISAITIMGNAGEMYAYGTQLWVMELGIALGMIVVAKVFVPILYPMNIVSLYQYIEQRFKSKILRQATVILQLVAGYFFIGFVLYPPSIGLEYFTGLSITTNIFIMGASCTLYSAFGGVKAVVYSDVFQSVVMIIGVFAIVIQGSVAMGGLDKIWDIAYHHDRIEFFNLNFDPHQRHSFWLCATFGFFFALSTYGVNQSQTQRFFSTGSVREAQWVLYYAAIGIVFFKSLTNLSGLVMYAVLKDCDPITNPLLPVKDPSVVTIHYVLTILTKIPGLAGIFVASIYAAVLSSVSTQLNSMTALVWEDFLKEVNYFSKFNEVKQGVIQKILVFLSGVMGIALGLVVSLIGRSFLRALFTISGALSGPLIGLFLVALFLPWVDYRGSSVGFLLAMVINIWIAVGNLFTQPPAQFLPLSRDGCPPTPIVNGSANINESFSTAIPEVNQDFFTTDATTEDLYNFTTVSNNSTDHGDVSGGIFALSYCLNYLWGTMVCIIISIIVSCLTGTNTVEDVDEKYIYWRSWQLFEKLTFLQGIGPLFNYYPRPPYVSPGGNPGKIDPESQEEKGNPSKTNLESPER